MCALLLKRHQKKHSSQPQLKPSKLSLALINPTSFEFPYRKAISTSTVTEHVLNSIICVVVAYQTCGLRIFKREGGATFTYNGSRRKQVLQVLRLWFRVVEYTYLQAGTEMQETGALRALCKSQHQWLNRFSRINDDINDNSGELGGKMPSPSMEHNAKGINIFWHSLCLKNSKKIRGLQFPCNGGPLLAWFCFWDSYRDHNTRLCSYFQDT